MKALEMAEIKKMDANKINKKIIDLKKEVFDHRQKLIKGELKDSSVIDKTKKNIARLSTVLSTTTDEEKKD